jgi:tRNA (adenine37-N6)-methyltransferase
VFHQAIRDDWQPTVRPPRLGGNKRVGVFASRSPYRPNPIGLSLVELDGIDRHAAGLALRIKGCDLVDGTPVLDIKPYLPYADFEPNAQAGYTRDFAMDSLPVSFSEEARHACEHYEQQGYENLMRLITRLIQQDPRPAYVEDDDARQFAFRLYEFDVVFHVTVGQAMVDALRPV